MYNKSAGTLVIVFFIIAVSIYIFRNFLELQGFDWRILSGGNVFLYIVTTLSMQMLAKGLNAENTNAFVRHAYSGILIKLFACAGVAFIYILVSGKNLNKPALFACMGLYLVYTFVELTVIMKQSNAKKNVKN